MAAPIPELPPTTTGRDIGASGASISCQAYITWLTCKTEVMCCRSATSTCWWPMPKDGYTVPTGSGESLLVALPKGNGQLECPSVDTAYPQLGVYKLFGCCNVGLNSLVAGSKLLVKGGECDCDTYRGCWQLESPSLLQVARPQEALRVQRRRVVRISRPQPHNRREMARRYRESAPLK